MTQRRRNLAKAIIGVAVLLPALYVGGYFGLAQTFSGVVPHYSCRFYRWQWLAEIYKPASKAEGWLTGGTVEVLCQPPAGP